MSRSSAVRAPRAVRPTRRGGGPAVSDRSDGAAVSDEGMRPLILRTTRMKIAVSR